MLNPATRLGPYEVVALLGAGGMGEVYRAHDTRLNRDVALKVLPEVFSRDVQRMARFEREAKLLASLNHPNIAAIYGLEESGPIRALVMELVEGSTLADRIRSGPIALDEALPIARQVADAVEYAHDNNVIHRDLKPANIKVKADGTVKVLDFGLAKAMSEEVSEADMSNSPTLSMAATRQGVILGTAAYMSPEQAKGKKVDRRTDVWAFGAVLYEMLTGKPAFPGDDITEVLASVVKTEPAFDALPAKTPPAIRTLLRRCLDKNLRQRMQNSGEARIAIENVLAGKSEAEAAAPASTSSIGRLAFPGLGAVTGVLLVALAAVSLAHFRETPEVAEAIRFSVPQPDGWRLPSQGGPTGTAASPVAVSPDGRRLAFVATAEGRNQLWVRALDVLTGQLLPGTERGHAPFWSPDSRSLAFFADGKLKKIELAGGPAVTLCNCDGLGGTWSRDGVIVFNPAIAAPLQKVPAAGGAPSAATVLRNGEDDHRNAFFLPDGRHFLYVALTAGKAVIHAASLDSTERKRLLEADSSEVFYSGGHILFLRETTLMAQPFDPQKLELTGEAFPVAEDIQMSGGVPAYGYFSASENGVLVYRTGTGTASTQLAWYDRSGKEAGLLGEPAEYANDIELSPDATRVSVSILDPTQRTPDIWIVDVARGLRTRFTFGPTNEQNSIWSPDGNRLAFDSRPKGRRDLYQKTTSGAGAEELLLEDDSDKYPVSWSPDGRFLMYNRVGRENSNDLFVLPLSGDPSTGSGQARKPVPFLQTQFSEARGRFSPDGRWVAYQSNESGRNEIYVVPFPGPGGKWQVSTGGGLLPRWRSNGSEIFYLAPGNKLMAAAVNGKGATFEVGIVKPLFDIRPAGGGYRYDVSADGQRFLVNNLPEQDSAAPITVVVNWTAGLTN